MRPRSWSGPVTACFQNDSKTSFWPAEAVGSFSLSVRRSREMGHEKLRQYHLFADELHERDIVQKRHVNQ